MTPEELAEVEERARKATAGPWEAERAVDLAGFEQNDLWIIMRGQPCAYRFDRTEDAEFCAHARADVPALCAEVRRLREERDEATAAERREHAAMILRDYRGVETPCPDCAGWGVQAYASTATWRGGVGGQAITTGVCDRCWGSGDATKPGANLRALEAELRRLREERDENFEDVARIRDFAAAEARKADERIGRAEAEVARLREALDAAGKLVKRYNVKTDDCRECGVNERCEAHR